MAVLFKDVKEKLQTTPLNEVELGLITDLELFIDDLLITGFDNQSLFILSEYIDFDKMSNRTSIAMKTTRKNLMRQELIRRYEKAGWAITESSENHYLIGEKK